MKCCYKGAALFFVRRLADKLVIENPDQKIVKMFGGGLTPGMDLHEAFGKGQGEDLGAVCRRCLKGIAGNRPFFVTFNGESGFLLHAFRAGADRVGFLNIQQNRTGRQPGRAFSPMHMHELCNITSEGMFVWNVSSGGFKLAYANPAYKRLEGLKASGAYGKTPGELFEPAKVDGITKMLEQCVHARRFAEHTVRRGSDQYRVRLAPGMENGRVKRVIGTISGVGGSYGKKSRSVQEDDQMYFKEIIAQSSREFIDAGFKGFDNCVGNLIEKLGKLLGADHACAIKSTDCIHGGCRQWAAKPEWLSLGYYHALLCGEKTSGCPEFQPGKIMVLNDAVKEKAHCETPLLRMVCEDGAKSLLAVPVARNGDRWGTLCLVQITDRRIWTTLEIGIMKNAAETIMSAYLRIKLERQLRDSNRVLVEYDECLQELLTAEEMIAKASRSYITTASAGFDMCTENMLESIGEVMDIDGICLSVCTETHDDTPGIMYEWRRKGVPGRSRRPGRSLCPKPVWYKAVSPEGMWVIDNTMNDDGFSGLLDGVAGTGVKSALVVPLKQGQKMWGALALFKFIGFHKWTTANINLAQAFSEVFLGAYFRMLEEEQLKRVRDVYAKMENEAVKHAALLLRLTQFARQFVDATAANLFPMADAMWGEAAKMLGIQKIMLLKLNKENRFVKYQLISDWNADNVPPCKTKMASDIPGGMGAGSRMICCVPIMFKERVWGCINISFLDEDGMEKRIDMVTLMAEFFARAYDRIFPDGERFLPSLRKTEGQPQPAPS